MTRLISVAMSLSLAASLTLGAQPSSGASPRGERLAARLHLSPAQQTQIRSLREAHRKDLSRLRHTAREARAALADALRDPACPTDQVRRLHTQASEARLAWLLARREVRLEVQAVLTPEQRAKADLLRDLARQRREGLGFNPRRDG